MWQIEKTTKHCQSCSRTIETSENYFSALFPASPEPNRAQESKEQPESRLVRQDFCANCWERRTASGEDMPFSFWQTVINPPLEPPKTPKQILLSFFDNLFISAKDNGGSAFISGGEPETATSPESGLPPAVPTNTALKDRVKYLFSLILLRKKLLRLKETFHKDNARFLLMERVSDNKSYQVPEITITESELVSLRDEFSKLFEFRI